MSSGQLELFAISFSVGGALITFGIMYGSLKKEQEAFVKTFDEFKKEIKDDIKAIRKDVQGITTRLHYHLASRAGNEEAD